MPVRQPEAVPITLAEREIHLIAHVLQHAAAECSAATTPSEPADAALDGGVTLGRLAVHWTDHVGRQTRHQSTGLLSVSQNREAWYQVRAALSDHAAQVSRDSEIQGLAAGDPARRRASDALLLADRIAEASHGW